MYQNVRQNLNIMYEKANYSSEVVDEITLEEEVSLRSNADSKAESKKTN